MSLKFHNIFIAIIVISLLAFALVSCGRKNSKATLTATDGGAFISKQTAIADSLISETGDTDPYAAQVEEYLRTGVPVLIPKWGDQFELPYIGPVLTREGVVERPGMPRPNLVIGTGDSTAENVNRDDSVVGLPNPKPAAVGSCRHVFLIITWSGQNQTVNAIDAYEKLFDDNAGHTCPSLTDFYDEMSYGKLSLTGDVYPSTGAYNINSPADLGAAVTSAMNASNDDVNYSQYDGDNDGYIDAITIILPHDIRAFVSYNWSGPLFDGKRICTIGFLGEEDLKPESRTAHHEMGHFFYLPDYYDYGGDSAPASPGDDGNESLGVGFWDLMCAGNFTNPPMPLSAYNKWLLDWVNPTVITEDTTGLVLKPSNYKENTSDIYVLWTGGVFDREFFLIENRWLTANSDYGSNPGKGLLIWHVDENEMIYPSSGYGVNDIEEHKALDLEEADGQDQIDHLESYGDGGDVYPYGSKDFTAASNPSSEDYTGTDTQVRITNIQKNTDAQTVSLDVTVTGFTFGLGNLPTLVASGEVDIVPQVNPKVERVELFINDDKVLDSSASPFSYTWDTTVDLYGQATVSGVGYGADEQKELTQDVLIDNMETLYPLADTAENGFYQFFPFEARYPSTTLRSGTRKIASDAELIADPDNGTGRWRQSSTWSQSGSTSFYFGTGGGTYDNYENDYLVSREIDLAGVSNPTLSFNTRYDIESNSDYGRVYVTPDNGKNFWLLASYTGTETNNRESISLDTFIGYKIRVLFFFESDESNTDNGTTINGSGWWLDDIVVFNGTVNQLPTISIVQPVDKQLVTTQMQVIVSTGGTLSEVDYLVYSDTGTLKSKSKNAPYSVYMQTEDFGNQRLLLEARAVTAEGLYSSDVATIDCYNLVGDTNNDKIVTAADLDMLLTHFGETEEDAGYRPWIDCDGDGFIDERDAAVIAYRLGNWLG